MFHRTPRGPNIVVSGVPGMSPVELETARGTAERLLMLSPVAALAGQVSISAVPGSRRVRAYVHVSTGKGAVSGSAVAPTTHDAVARAVHQLREEASRLPRAPRPERSRLRAPLGRRPQSSGH